jgi:Flagellar assembly protein T, C-terminal domain
MSDKQIALNVGEEHGVEAGMKFAIFAPKDEILDPQTGESLGEFRQRKATVKVTMVSKKFCFAGPVARSRFLSGFYKSMLAGGEMESVESPLPVEKSQLEPLISGTSIRIGDLAEQVRAPVQNEERSSSSESDSEPEKTQNGEAGETAADS